MAQLVVVRMTVNIPASPGKSARQARLALRFGPITIKRPERGMPSPDLKRLPETVGLHLVDIREVDTPKGVDPIHCRLLTSHVIEDFGTARLMLDFYRKHWIIEDYFRTLKSAGFKVEDARMTDPAVFMNFVALAAIAAVTATQMLRSRNNTSGQPLADACQRRRKSRPLWRCKTRPVGPRAGDRLEGVARKVVPCAGGVVLGGSGGGSGLAGAALSQAIGVAIHLEDADMVGHAVQ